MKLKGSYRLLFICFILIRNHSVYSINKIRGSTSNLDTASDLTGVELDIKRKRGSDQFDFILDGTLGTYTTKEGYVFNRIKLKNEDIWKPRNTKEYSDEVVVEGFGSRCKTVTIRLKDGTQKEFTKSPNSSCILVGLCWR